MRIGVHFPGKKNSNKKSHKSDWVRTIQLLQIGFGKGRMNAP